MKMLTLAMALAVTLITFTFSASLPAQADFMEAMIQIMGGGG
jgi:hypothetical protein